MTKKRTRIDELDCQLSFVGDDGSLHIYQAQAGGFFLHTHNIDQCISGVSITGDELIELAAALTRLAQNDKR